MVNIFHIRPQRYCFFFTYAIRACIFLYIVAINLRIVTTVLKKKAPRRTLSRPRKMRSARNRLIKKVKSLSDYLHQLEVNLVAVEVDAGDLDGDFVAEDEVLGVFDGDHGDESFAAGGLELDKEAEIGDAGDEAGEDLAHMVFYPHGLEHLDGVAFGLGSLLFARRAVLAFILEFFAGQCFFFPG